MNAEAPFAKHVETVKKEPSTERGRRTRASIVDAAADLMYAQGVAATSIDQVIAKSGTGKSQMYHYFASKDDLVQAVVDRQIGRALGGQPRLFAIESWEDLVAWAEDLVAFHQGSSGPLPCPIGTLAAEIDRDDTLRPAIARAFEQWLEPLEVALTKLRVNGEIPGDSQSRRLALRVMVVLQGGMLMARTLDDPTILADSVDALLAEIHGARCAT
jgi:AcrR family transcriptional regulator